MKKREYTDDCIMKNINITQIPEQNRIDVSDRI